MNPTDKSRSRTLARHPWLAVLLAGVIAALGIYVNHHVPPGPDQGLFLYVSQKMSHGAALYRDLWDIKQPGIVWFYQAAQAMRGPGWHSVVVVYAVWAGATAALLTAMVLHIWPGSRWWWLAPMATAIISALRMNSDHYAEIECLVDLPLLGIITMGLIGMNSKTPASTYRWTAFVAGVLACIVCLFKIVLAPVAGLVFLSFMLQRERRHALMRDVQWFATGFLLTSVPTLLHFWLAGQIDVFLWTMLRYPFLILQDAPLAPLARMVGSIQWLAFGMAWMLPAILAALHAAIRGVSRDHRATVIALLVWIGSGMVMITMQKFSWWGYHFELLLWPLGALAALGAAACDTKRTRAPEQPRRSPTLAWLAQWNWAAISIVVAVVVNLAYTGQKRMRDPEWATTAPTRDAIDVARRIGQGEFGNLFPCGTAYVFGDARMLLASGLRQTISEVGMNWYSFLQLLAHRLPAELSVAQPDLLHVDEAHKAYFDERNPELRDWIDSHYEPFTNDAAGGTWLKRRPGVGTPGCGNPVPFTIPEEAK